MAAWDLNRRVNIFSVRNDLLSLVDTIEVPEVANNMDNTLLDIQYIHGGKDILLGSNNGRPVIISVEKRRVVQTLKHTRGSSRYPIGFSLSPRD